MSGREANGWGECVWCGEQLKPEDKNPYSDLCEFCEKWNSLVQLVIKRKFFAVKKVAKAKEDKNKKALAYWRKRETLYGRIHKTLIRALNIKKAKMWGEDY